MAHAGKAAAADCFADYAWLLENDGTSCLVASDPFVEESGHDLAPYGTLLLAEATRGGRLWGLPLQTDGRFAYCNRELLDSLGVAAPAADWGPVEFVATASAATDLAVDPPAYGFLPRDGAYGDLPAYLSSLGASLVGPDGGLTLNDPSVAEALSLWVELAAVMPPAARDYDNAFGREERGSGGHPPLVADGSVAIWLGDYLNHSVAEPLDFAVGVTTMPAGEVAMTGTGMTVLYISAGGDRPDACWQWPTFPAAQREAVTLLPAREDVAQSGAWPSQVDADTAAAWASLASWHPTTDSTGAMLSSGAHYWLKEAVHEAIDGRAPEEALAEAQEHATAFLTCFAGLTEGSASAIEAYALQAEPDVVVR